MMYYLQEVGRIGRSQQALDDAGLKQVTATLFHGDEDFAHNQELSQRARIGADDLKDLWRQLVQRSRQFENVHLVLMPSAGFAPADTEAVRRQQETRLRMTLYWLECCRRLDIVGQNPGLLRVQLFPQGLETLSSEEDSVGQVATALLQICREPLPSVSPHSPVASQPISKTSAGVTNQLGLIGRVASFLGQLIGISLGPVSAPPKVLQSSIDSVSETAVESIIDVPTLFRATTLASPDQLLSVLRQVEKRGGLDMLHELELKPKPLATALQPQIRELFDHLAGAAEEIAGALLQQPNRRLELEDMPIDPPSLCREGPPRPGSQQPEPAQLHLQTAEHAVLYLLRVSGVRVLEQERDGSKPSWSLRLSPRDAKGLRERILRLLQLARILWDKLREPIHRQSQGVSLSALVDAFGERTFNGRQLKLALGLLSKLRLCTVSGDLLGMTYVLALKEIDQAFSVPEEVLEKLQCVNRMTELRAHAMEIFSHLDADARRLFIDGYFQIARPDALEIFLAEQLTLVDAPDSPRMQSKLAQIRKEAIAERFADYLNEDAPEPNQWRAISHPRDEHLLVIAGPGAGKTRVLIDRVVYLIDRADLDPSAIMVLAFNRAIVHEIRIRLRETFDAVGYGAMVRRVRVHTFHGLAARLLRRISDGADLLGDFIEWLKVPGNAAVAADGLRAILVDEYQDVEAQREKILLSLQQASGASLFAIGDDDQDILGFADSEANTLLAPGYHRFEHFKEHLSLTNSQFLQLKKNFRSDRLIVQRSNNLLDVYVKRNPNYRRLKDTPLQPFSTKDGLAKHETSRDEMIQQLGQHVSLAREKERSIAMLCRTNQEVIEVAKRLQSIGQAMEIRTSDPYSVDRLRHYALFLDSVAELMNSGKNPLVADPAIEDLLAVWEKLPIPEARSGSSFGTPRDLVSLTLKQNRFARTKDLLENSRSIKSDELIRILNREQTGNCMVSTIHRVKGLEFDEVLLLPSVSEFPFGRNSKRQDVGLASAEEMRLFYVGMTRAKFILRFGWGEREKAWLEKRQYNGGEQQSLGKKVLGGRLDEVDISWAARSGCGRDLQDYIERQVQVGDPLSVENERYLVHEDLRGQRRRIGALKKGHIAGSKSSLNVVAVSRYPQVLDPLSPHYWEMLTDQVKARGWSYVVLAAGYLIDA